MINLRKGKKLYSLDKIDAQLYNSADEWIDFDQGIAIFGIGKDTLKSNIKKYNLSIEKRKGEDKVIKSYFRKLDFIKLSLLRENDAVKSFNIPLNMLNKLMEEGSLDSIQIDGDIYYYHKFNKQFNSKYTSTKFVIEHNNSITLQEAYKMHSHGFDNFDDFILHVFENRNKFYLRYVYKLNEWYISSNSIGVKKTSSTNKLNIELYYSASEWIDFKEGEKIFGVNSNALNSKIKNSGVPIQVKNVKGKVQKYYFRKFDYIKLYFVEENEAIKIYNIPLKVLNVLANDEIVDSIQIDGVIYYNRRLRREYNTKYTVTKSDIKQSNAIAIEKAYKFKLDEFYNYDDFALHIFENRDKFHLKYVYELKRWFISNEIMDKSKKRIKSANEYLVYHKKIDEAYPFVSKLFDSYEKFKDEVMSDKKRYDVKVIKNEYYVNLSRIFYKASYAAKELNMNYRVLLKWVSEGFFEKKYISEKHYLIESVKDKTYKHYCEFKADKNNKLPILPREMFQSHSDMIDYYLKWINDRTEFNDSLKWIGYSIHNYSERSEATRSKHEQLKSYLLAAFRLVQNLKKEIYDYDNKEINQLYEDILKCKDDIDSMRTFLSYIMHNKPDCAFNDLPQKYIKNKKEKSLNDRFSPEIVEKYFHYLADLDKHFLNAINDYRYAQLWLIAILHLSLPRRIGNMIDLPKPDIELINIKNFDDLFDREITISDMQLIIDNIKAKSYGEVASKNGWDLAFVRDLDLITQTGIAFTICELHRRKKGQEILNFSFKNNNPKTNDWKRFFADDSLKGFGNLKAVRSFLTDLYKYVSSIPDLKAFSYSIITKFRAHKTNGIDESEVTKEYLEITKIDGFQDKIIYNVQRIGAFGFLYDLMTNLVYDTSESSLEYRVSYLEILKENLHKKSIEDLSLFLSNTTESLNKIPKEIVAFSNEAKKLLDSKLQEDMKDYNQYKISEQIALAKEVIKLSREDIINKFENIFKNQLNSKQPYCYCFKGFKNCNKKSNSSSVCIVCKYSIPTIHALTSLRADLSNLFDKIKKTSLDNVQMLFKYKILLLKYTGVIVDVYNEFYKYDMEFINSFINLSELKQQIIYIEKNIFDKAGGLR